MRYVAACLFVFFATEYAGAQFRSQSDYVLLSASVRDGEGKYVGNLKKDQFTVFDDGKPVQITHFASTDSPVTVGLIVDESASMTRKRVSVITAGMFFAKQSNPLDEFFVVNFNERPYFALPGNLLFTDKLTTLRSALYFGNPTGRTAIYDAIGEGLDRLREGRRDVRVLIVVSDGGDNASRMKFPDLIKQIESSHAVIYTVGLLDPEDTDLNPGLLRKIAHLSGGEMFTPETDNQLSDAFQSITRDVRNRYVLGFTPVQEHSARSVHKLRVTVQDENGTKFKVNARPFFVNEPDLKKH